jgi:hypothetical protein
MLQRWEREQNLDPLDYCCGAVESVNQMFDTSLPFELLLTELDKRIQSPRDIYEKAGLPVIRGQIQQLVCRFFDSIRSYDAILYEAFSREVLNPGDIVVTFNYDLALDRELQRSGKWSAKDGYGFALNLSAQHCSPCKLYKLHGSTNWIAQILSGLRPGGFSMGTLGTPFLGHRPVIPTSDLEFLGAAVVDPQFQGTGGYQPGLIMPAAEKKFYFETSVGREWKPFWDSLWEQAGEGIASAEAVYIIGYSLPEYDHRARQLLLGAARRTCDFSISCRCDSGRIMSVFQEAGFTRAHLDGDGSFEHWLQAQRIHT